MEDQEDELRLPPAVGAPWIVYTHYEAEEIQTFCEISHSNPNNSTNYSKSIPELRGKSICASCHGWLILRDLWDGKMFSLWKPSSLQSMSLPPLPIDGSHMVRSEGDEAFTLITSDVGGADDRSDNVCVVLLFFGNIVFVYRPTPTRTNASCGWVRHSVELDGGRLEMHEVITVNNILYGWARNEEFGTLLLSMEVCDDASNSLIIKSLQIDWPRSGIACVHRMDYWVESCGRVYHVCAYIRHGGDDRISMVKVLELDLARRTLVEVKSLDGRAFFVGKDCSTWCWGGDGGSDSVQGNSIYFLFMKMLDDQIFYSYNLEEGSLSVFLSCPVLKYPYSPPPIWLNMAPQQDRLLLVQDKNGNEGNQLKDNVFDEVVDHGMISISTKREEFPQEQEKQVGECRLIELPDHLIHLISKDMHLFDFWNFRATCTTFQSIVPPAPFCKTNNMIPLFVFMKSDGRSCEIIDPCRVDSCFNSLQLSSDPFAIDYSKNGWLVISVGPDRMLKYFNPFTRERGVFSVDHSMSCYSCIIGFSTFPTSPDFRAIAVVDKFLAVEISYFQYGDEAWDSFEFRYEDLDLKFRLGTSSPLYFARAFYVLDETGCLGEFALVDGEGSWRVFCRPEIHCFRFHSSHLVECGGELYAVFIGYMGRWIKVFKFNFQKEKWDQVKSLGKFSLFVSHTSSFSAELAEVRMQNRIYLSRLKDNHILFYSLETGKYHVSGSEESVDNFYSTKEPMQCCWL